MTQDSVDKGMVMTAGYLEDLLGRQIERLRAYDLDGAMACAEESEQVAARLTAAQFLDQPQNADQKARIKSLYRELMLVIASERQEVSDKMAQIRDGLKTLGTYAGK